MNQDLKKNSVFLEGGDDIETIEQNQQQDIKESKKQSIQPDKNNEPEIIKVAWNMFQEVDYLGQGAFGDVLKVKCLQSTSLSEDGASRIKMDASTVKRAKQERIKAEISVGGGASSINTQQNCIDKPLFEDENYVIKVINVANLNQKAQFDALNEIETMQVMNSPFVVGYYDSFIDDDDEEPKINIVIEYCPNGDLSNFITKQSTLGTTVSQPTAVGGQLKKDELIRYFNENLVWKIFINLCLGLEHMHSKNYIHRDLKTLNIFMAKENVAKIGDLGCALNLSKLQPIKKQNESNIKDIEMVVEPSEEGLESPRYLFDEVDDQNLLTLNETNLLSSLHSSEKKEEKKENKKQVIVQQLQLENQEDTAGCPESELDDENPVGTPYYLSPEIWKEKRYSRASDIWALGVILYELLNLKKPFPAQDKDELVNKVYTQQPEKMRSGISQAFQTLVQGMLKREAKKRLTIEEIIFSEDFQKMSQKLKINLPLKLNKEKLQQKIIANQLQNTDVRLTPFLEKLFEKELKTMNNLPTLQKVNSQAIQNQNLSNLKQKQQQQVIQKQTSKVESLVKRASLKIQSKDSKTNQKTSPSMSIMGNNDKKIQDKTAGKLSKQDIELEKKTSVTSKEEQKINYSTKDSTVIKKVNSSQNDLLKDDNKEVQSVSSFNTLRGKNSTQTKLSQQSNKLQSQQSEFTEDNKNHDDQVYRTKSQIGVNLDQKSSGLSAVSSQASVAKGKVNQTVKQNISAQSSIKKVKDVEDSGTASKLSIPATSSIFTTPRVLEKPGSTGKREIFSKKSSCVSSTGTGPGTIFSSEAQKNSKIFGDLVHQSGNNNLHKKKDSVDQNKPKHNFKGGLKNTEQQQEVTAQKLVEGLQKKDISSKNSVDATMDIEERLSSQNSPYQIQKQDFEKSQDKPMQVDNKISKIQQPQNLKKEEEKQKLTEKKPIDTISNNSQVMKFEYGVESPSIHDDEEIRTSIVKEQPKKEIKKDQNNLKTSLIPKNTQISEVAQTNRLRLNKGKVIEKESTKAIEKESLKPAQKRQSLKEHKIEKAEDGKYQVNKLSRESIVGQEEKKKTGSASKTKNVQFRNSIIVNPITKLNQDNRRVTIAGTKNQNTSRPSMLTQRKTDDNPFEKAESVKTKNLLSVRIDPKKDNKKDKLSAGLQAKNKIEKQSKCPSLNSSQKSNRSFLNRGPITRQKTFAKKSLQKNLMITEGSDDERMNPFASVQEPEICPFDNINESDRKKSPNTSGDSLENPLNTENEPVSVSRQMEYKGLRTDRNPSENKDKNSPQKVIVLDQQDVKQPLSTRSGAGKSFQAFLQAHKFDGGPRPTSSTLKIPSSNLSKGLLEEPNSFNVVGAQDQKNAFVDFKERMLRNSKSQNKNESITEMFENEQNQNNNETYNQQKAQYALKMSVISESPTTITSSQIDGDIVKNEKVTQFNQQILSGKVEIKPNPKDDSPIKQESLFKQSFAEKQSSEIVKTKQVSGLKTIGQKNDKRFDQEKVLKQDKQDNQAEVRIEWTDAETEDQQIPLRQQTEQDHQFMSPAFPKKPANNQPTEIPQPVINKQKSESDFQGPPSLQFAEGRKRLGTLVTPSRLKVIEEQKQESEKESKQADEKKNIKSNLNQSRLSQKSDQMSAQSTPLRGLKKRESAAKQEQPETPKTTGTAKNKK